MEPRLSGSTNSPTLQSGPETPIRDPAEATMSGNSDTKTADPATSIAQFWAEWFAQSND